MKIVFLFSCLVICCSTSAQHLIGIKANGGVSKITSNISSDLTKQTIYFRPSYYAGAFYNYKVKNKFTIGIDVLYNKIEGKERLETPVTDPLGNQTGEIITDEITKHISYLSIPLYFGYTIKKINFNLAFQTSLLLSNSGREKGQAPYNGTVTVWDRTGKLNIDDYDYGLRLVIGYDLTLRFSIEANYYYGLNNILRNNITIPNWEWKIQQATLGVNYKFYKK